VAATAGRGLTFGFIAAAVLVLAGITLRVSAPSSKQSTLDFQTVITSSRVRAAAALTAVLMFTLGTLMVLGALQLDRLGAGPAAIAAVLMIAAGVAAVQGPLVGRWSDRSGRLRPIRVGLLAGVPTVARLAFSQDRLVLAALLVSAMITVRFSTGPTVARLSDALSWAYAAVAIVLVGVLAGLQRQTDVACAPVASWCGAPSS
jgi:hypothetical protein